MTKNIADYRPLPVVWADTDSYRLAGAMLYLFQFIGRGELNPGLIESVAVRFGEKQVTDAIQLWADARHVLDLAYAAAAMVDGAKPIDDEALIRLVMLGVDTHEPLTP